MPNVSLTQAPTDFSLQQQQIDRQRAMAQALQQQAFAPGSPNNEMAGGYVVRKGFGFDKLAQALAGQYGQSQADTQAKELAGQQQQALVEGLKQYQQTRQGTPGQAEIPAPADEMGGGPGRPQTPGVPGNPQAAAMGLIGSQHPMLQQMGMQQLTAENKPFVVGRSLVDPTGKVLGVDQTWQAEQQAAREQKAQELQMKMEDKHTSDKEKADLQIQLKQMGIDSQRALKSMMSANQAVTPVDIVKDGRVVKVDARTGREIGISSGDTKLQGQFNQDTAALQGTTNSMDRLQQAANEVLKHPGLGGITGKMSVFPNMPGGAAADAQAKLATLKSQVGFGVLQDMRNNSKTGGALGAISDQEGKRLEANLSALENSQSEKQMKESLQKIVDYTEGAKDRLRSAYNLKHGDKAAAPTGAAPAKAPGLTKNPDGSFNYVPR